MTSPRLVAQGQQRRDQIVELVAEYRRRHKYSPSIAELAEALQIESSAVRRHVKLLIEEGRLVQTAGVARSLRTRKKAS